MRRVYRRDGYRRTVERLRAAVPDLGVGADVLVGFPGETREAFDATVELVQTLALSYLHVFPYSPRPRTVAATLPAPVASAEIRARVGALTRVGDTLRAAFERAAVGRVEQVLVERRRRGALLFGRSERYVGVRFDGDDALVGRCVPVEVLAYDGQGARGRVVAGNPAWERHGHEALGLHSAAASSGQATGHHAHDAALEERENDGA